MRRVIRRLFALCSAASLALCLGACVLWARGQSGTDVARWARVREQPRPTVTWYVFYAYPDGLSFEWDRQASAAAGTARPDPGGPTRFRTLRHKQAAAIPRRVHPPSARARAGFVLSRERPDPRDDVAHDQLTIAVPHWAAVLVTAMLPAWTLLGALRRRRRRGAAPGRCAACGYDLRASPAGCPECGAGDSPARRVHPVQS